MAHNVELLQPLSSQTNHRAWDSAVVSAAYYEHGGDGGGSDGGGAELGPVVGHPLLVLGLC